MKELLRGGEVCWEYYYTELVDVVVCDREESIKELWEKEEEEGPPVVTSQWVILSHKCGAVLPYPKLPSLLVHSVIDALYHGHAGIMSFLCSTCPCYRLL